MIVDVMNPCGFGSALIEQDFEQDVNLASEMNVRDWVPALALSSCCLRLSSHALWQLLSSIWHFR